jgi:hypothetical protein
VLRHTESALRPSAELPALPDRTTASHIYPTIDARNPETPFPDCDMSASDSDPFNIMIQRHGTGCGCNRCNPSFPPPFPASPFPPNIFSDITDFDFGVQAEQLFQDSDVIDLFNAFSASGSLSRYSYGPYGQMNGQQEVVTSQELVSTSYLKSNRALREW